MNSMNFVGNLTKVCKTGMGANNNAYCHFTVATTTGWGDNRDTLFIQCSLFGKRVVDGLTSRLVKGAPVTVFGENVQLGEYNGKAFIKVNVSDIKVHTKGEQFAEKGAVPDDRTANDFGDAISF